MKKQEIVSVLYELHKITGFRVSLHDTELREVAAYPLDMLPVCKLIHGIEGERKKCQSGDAEGFLEVKKTGLPHVYRCRFGMTEAISPLYNFGTLTGYLMMGQVVDSGNDRSQLLDALVAIGADQSVARRKINAMRAVPEEMLGSYLRIMTICAQYLTLSNAVPGAKPSVSRAAHRFIHENISKKITIRDICAAVGCSKTNLIASYKRDYGMTINCAINEAKLSEAKRLLDDEDISISEIAERTGFYDQSYFSKVFSARCGIAPSEYRRQRLSEKERKD
jgi:AraC-like DNA-binding protein